MRALDSKVQKDRTPQQTRREESSGGKLGRRRTAFAGRFGASFRLKIDNCFRQSGLANQLNQSGNRNLIAS